MLPEGWVIAWDALLSAVVARGGKRKALTVAPPASEHEVAAVEHTLATALPPSFRSLLTSFAAEVRVWWWNGSAPREPRELSDLATFGELSWSLNGLLFLEELRGSLEEIYADASYTFAEEHVARALHAREVLRDKLAFQMVGNGDLIAIDLKTEAVVYLDHSGDIEGGHGVVLAPSFPAFVTRFTNIGCSGPDWFILKHVYSADGIDDGAPAAVAFRRWLGLAPSPNAF